MATVHDTTDATRAVTVIRFVRPCLVVVAVHVNVCAKCRSENNSVSPAWSCLHRLCCSLVGYFPNSQLARASPMKAIPALSLPLLFPDGH